MGISKISYGSGENLFEISYKNDEVIATSGDNSFMSPNFEANSFAAFQSKKLTKFFEAGTGWNYASANADNCIWQKFDNTNHTDILAGADNPDGYFTLNSIIVNDGSNARIVTDLTDIQRVVWRPEIQEDSITTQINGTSTTVTIYKINTSTSQNRIDIIDKDNPMHYTVQNVAMWPWLLNPNDKSQLQLHFKRYDQLSAYGNYCERNSGSRVTGINNERYYPVSTAMINYEVPLGNNQNFGFYSDDNRYIFHCTLNTNNYAQCHLNCYICSEDELKLYLASCGFKFLYKNKLYKPVAENDVIVGYTDDLLSRSDWDDWHTRGDHDIPVTPPSPGPGPYDDDPWSGATFAGTGVGGAGVFAKVYYMTSTELANLRSWMNSINVPEGFDPMQQIIGLSQVPVALSGSSPENVVFVNSSAVYDPGVTTRAVDTGVSTQQAMGTPISYYLGSVDIVRRMQERGEPYLDYDCQIELYLPLIGMFSLDTQAVMGRTISAYAVLDPVSGTLAAYAYVTKDGQNLPVAYGSTSIGVDLPISAQQLSVSRAALKQANAQLGASLLSGALTMLAAASSGGKSSGSGAKTSTGSSGLSAAGIREAGSDYMKASQVGNVFGDFMQWGRTIRQLSYGNNTAVAGSFGGSTAQWSYPFTPYVKIIRPRFEKPSNYAHSQGVPCVQAKTIGSCTGFIQCIGADVSGITGATDLELQAIQAALSNGIYAGGGS